jgi:hypothetical protein
VVLVLECRQTPYRATLLLLGSELEQPFVLLGSFLSFLPKLPSSHFSPSPNQWGAASIHQTRRHLPCIPCKSSHPHLLIKEASAATNQVRRSDYLHQDVCVHTDSALMWSLSGYLLFGHSATDPFNSGTLPSTDSGTGWHFLLECHYYSPLIISNSETSGSKIRENPSSWKQARMILFMNMKTRQIFKNKNKFKFKRIRQGLSK